MKNNIDGIEQIGTPSGDSQVEGFTPQQRCIFDFIGSMLIYFLLVRTWLLKGIWFLLSFSNFHLKEKASFDWLVDIVIIVSMVNWLVNIEYPRLKKKRESDKNNI